MSCRALGLVISDIHDAMQVSRIKLYQKSIMACRSLGLVISDIHYAMQVSRLVISDIHYVMHVSRTSDIRHPLCHAGL